MSNRVLASLLVAACACTPAPGPGPQPTASTSPTGSTAAAVSPHDAARARVAELASRADANPTLAAFTGPYGGVPAWDKVKPDLFPAAFELGLALLLAEVDVIATSPEAPTFQNTIAALEDAGRHQGRAETLFSVLTSNLNTPDGASHRPRVGAEDGRGVRQDHLQ
jgi:hypothetical protein